MLTGRDRYLLYVYFLDFNRMVGHRDVYRNVAIKSKKFIARSGWLKICYVDFVIWMKNRLTQQLHLRGVVIAGDGYLPLHDPVHQVGPLPRGGVVSDLDFVRLHVDVDEERRCLWEVHHASQAKTSVNVTSTESPPEVSGEAPCRSAFSQEFCANASFSISYSTMDEEEILGLDDPRDNPASLRRARNALGGGHDEEVLIFLRLSCD